MNSFFGYSVIIVHTSIFKNLYIYRFSSVSAYLHIKMLKTTINSRYLINKWQFSL